MGIFTIDIYIFFLGSKNTLKFSIKISYLTFTVHRLLSHRLLCCNEAIFASYPWEVRLNLPRDGHL